MNSNTRKAVSAACCLGASFALISSFGAQADVCSELECLFFHGHGGVAASKSAQENDAIYHLGGGVILSDYFALGLDAVHITNHQGDAVTGASFYGRLLAPTSTKAKLYLDAGTNTLGNHFTFGAGFLYNVSRHADLDFGYRHYGDVTDEQGDVYIVGVGLQYHFAPNSAESPTYAPQTVIYSQPSDLKEPEEDVTSIPTERCEGLFSSTESLASKETQLYTIVEGDWPIGIANKHRTTLDVLMSLNDWLVPRVKNDMYIYPGEQLIIPKLRK